MSSASPSGPGADGRLERCIRDLAALNALPSVCVGRTPDEALEIVLDALPTVLSCELIYLRLSGPASREKGIFAGTPLTAAQLEQFRAAVGAEADGTDAQLFWNGRRLWCLEVEVPMGNQRGRLFIGRGAPLDAETDRVLARTAANVVGTILETAHVLEVARRKDDFLAMLGHELRNPLAPITTAVELLARHPAAVRERTVIERHTRHLARLVDDLLDISRVTRGHVELRKEPVALATVLEQAVETAAPLMARNQHRLHVGGAEGVLLQGDPVRLAQVFGNLLTNAAKFTPPGGAIEVLVERDRNRVLVTVRDDGPGIEREQLQRIFEPFVQGDPGRDSKRGGLGLGLAIVKDLVERHGGTVTVRSEGRGKGASFTVDLPVAAQLEPAKQAGPPPPSPLREGLRVLVVDDNVDVAELLAEALRDEGFETQVAHDGQGALVRWRSFLPHAGVLDVGLPDLDGYQLAKALRAEYGRSATLIAATGYGRPTDRLRAVDAGFDDHLVKPVRIQDLVILLDARARQGDPPPTADRQDGGS